jgi:hypothetical protein
MDAFGTVVVVVCVVAAVVSVALFVRAGRLYQQIGRVGRFSLTDGDDVGDPAREAIRAEVERQLAARSGVLEPGRRS